MEHSQIWEYELKMLQYNDIKGLIKPTAQWEDQWLLLDFDITGMTEGAADEVAVERYLQGLIELESLLPEYFLTTEGLQIRPEGALYHAESRSWRFCYLPLKDKSAEQSLEFFRSLFQKQPRLYLQMEMMKEDPELDLRDYLAAAKNTLGC